MTASANFVNATLTFYTPEIIATFSLCCGRLFATEVAQEVCVMLFGATLNAVAYVLSAGLIVGYFTMLESLVHFLFFRFHSVGSRCLLKCSPL
jgi:phosphate starvation-inducible membrane PsiE